MKKSIGKFSSVRMECVGRRKLVGGKEIRSRSRFIVTEPGLFGGQMILKLLELNLLSLFLYNLVVGMYLFS